MGEYTAVALIVWRPEGSGGTGTSQSSPATSSGAASATATYAKQQRSWSKACR